MIFEDGYLKSEFVNLNYRGLVGWECHRKDAYTMALIGEKGEWITDTKLTSVDGDQCYLGGVASGFFFPMAFNNSLRILQFTPQDIPKGELVWVFDLEYPSEPKLRTFGGYTENELHCFHTSEDDTVGYLYCVPYLIAETAEKAEELKDWCK